MTTPEMSTYLLAFTVSEYISTDQEGIHRIFARPEEIHTGKANYALSTSIKALNALEDFLGISYVLQKMDQAAIPDNYFHYSAMENWGLVTYK